MVKLSKRFKVIFLPALVLVTTLFTKAYGSDFKLNPSSKIDTSLMVPKAGMSEIEFPKASGRALGKEEGKKILVEIKSEMEALNNLESEFRYDMIFLGSTDSLLGYAFIHPGKEEAYVNLNVRGKEVNSYYIGGNSYREMDQGEFIKLNKKMEEELSLQYYLEDKAIEKMGVYEREDGSYLLISEDFIPIIDFLEIVPNAKTLIPNFVEINEKIKGKLALIANREKKTEVILLEVKKETGDKGSDFKILLENRFKNYNNANEILFPKVLVDRIKSSNSINGGGNSRAN